MIKLNARGFSHDVFLVLFMLVFAIAGTGYIVASHANAVSVMYDTCLPNTVPANAKVVATYVSGPCAAIPAAKKRFPNATIVSINEHPGDDEGADIWGIESGSGKTVSGTINAIASGKVHGVYGSASDLRAVRDGLTSRHVPRSSYVLWLWAAGTQGQTAIPAGFDAHQYKVTSGYDVSTISPTFVSTIKGANHAGSQGGTATPVATTVKASEKLTAQGAALIKTCGNEAVTGAIGADRTGRTLLHEYRAGTDPQDPSKMLRDHIYITWADNIRFANSGYCREPDHGWVYTKNPKDISGAVVLWQSHNKTTKHYFYATTADLGSVPAGFTGKTFVAYVSNKNVASGSNSTRPIYRLYNPHTLSYYYVGDDGDINRAINGEGSQGYNPPDKSHPAFYVWNNDVKAAKPPSSPSGGGETED